MTLSLQSLTQIDVLLILNYIFSGEGASPLFSVLSFPILCRNYCNTLINVADFVAQLELSEGVVALPVTSEILSCDCYMYCAGFIEHTQICSNKRIFLPARLIMHFNIYINVTFVY